MTTTAEQYGFGARATYAQPRQSEYDMKERVRLSGLFPRVRNEPMSNQLRALLKEFENNAALTGILERRRRLENRLQFELQGSEGIDAINRNLAPPFRTGLAGAATSAAVAETLARSRVAARVEAAAARKRAADILAAQTAANTAAANVLAARTAANTAVNVDPGEIPVSDELTMREVAARTPKARSRSRATTRGRSVSQVSSGGRTDISAMSGIE